MECPRCKQSDISVIDSRDCDNESIRRRRQCGLCHFRFTTYERIEPIKLMVQKRDGSVELYQREKLLGGLERAVEKRHVPAETLQAIADRIEMKILSSPDERISSKIIGDYVIAELRDIDHVAYLRFASVYRSFETLEAFEKEVARIKESKKRS